MDVPFPQLFVESDVVPVAEFAVWVLSSLGDGGICTLAFNRVSFGCLFWKKCVQASDHCLFVGG